MRAIHAGWAILTAVVALWFLVVIWWLVADGASRFATPVPPVRVGLPWISYWFPPLPPDLLVQSLPASRIALDVLSHSILAFALALILWTWIATPLSLNSALRMGVFQLIWFPTYVLGILPMMLGSLAVTAFGLGFISTLFDLKFTMQLPDGTTWDIGPGWRELGTGILVALLLAGLAYCVSWLVWRALKPIIDVVRYLGDPRLREIVQGQFLTSITELTTTAPRIIVAAHSLGTVITVNSLLSHPETWTKFEVRRSGDRGVAPASIARALLSERISTGAGSRRCDRPYVPFDAMGERVSPNRLRRWLTPGIADHQPLPLSKRVANA